MEMVEIRIELIDEDKAQPRYQFDDEALRELMNSIGELGLLSPIKVRKTEGGRYKIVYGNRRYKACRELGLATIPCIVSEAAGELDIYLEQIAENLTREGFSPIEEAEAFHKLLNDERFASSVKFLSGKLGKPESYIKNKCELLKFGAAVRKLVIAGTQIRKDRLTEDQLLPLKDLPMEYRDPLALTFARDETPVPDIKRIAKLFKDESISAGLKDKLLYKSGYELMETWSTFEHNRKERARREAEKAQAAAEAAKRAEEAPEERTDDEAPAEPEKRAADAPETGAAPAAAAQARPDRDGHASEAAAGAPEPEAARSVGSKLQQLLSAASAAALPTDEEIRLIGELSSHEAEPLLEQAGQLVDRLERQLAAWSRLQAAVPARK
ncbi:ParB/RepB/Spo0J family partition protein [Cohnella zeiphila]|uniref:ParB/RepB/Spo0J family partition protein n=1 Tax=Cohnella zeiphila TaxID=2761120 RepID=A0A7X0VVB9_9BACL|nr:ParB/RepB/Spo0J family partition protein [Cohnella zeiphila]MBB6731811.1 ParB/RepB/Spo0J family partition protein [Cohnella zeiphila]